MKVQKTPCKWGPKLELHLLGLPWRGVASQWLRLQVSNAGGPCSVPGQGTRSHMLQFRIHLRQLKIPHVTTKKKIPHATTQTEHSQIIFFLLSFICCRINSPLPRLASLVAQTVKRLPAMLETRARSLGQEDPLEKEMAIHSSTLAWKIPWTEEPCKLQSMGSQRVGPTSLHFTST